MNRSFRLAAALALIVLLVGCSKGNLPSELTSPDDIAINGITPLAGTRLAPGSTVTFTANVAYILASASTGVVTMVIEDQNSVPLPGNPAQMSVTSGQSTVKLTSPAISVPATGVSTIQVFVSLTPAGSTSTSTIDVVLFPVGT
jgi:hypothetical protein